MEESGDRTEERERSTGVRVVVGAGSLIDYDGGEILPSPAFQDRSFLSIVPLIKQANHYTLIKFG